MSRARRKRSRTKGTGRGLRGLLLKVVVVGALLVAVLAGAAVLGFRAWLDRFLGSEEFERLLAREVGRATHSRVSFGGLNRGGATFYLDNIELLGYADADFERLTADRIRIDMNWGGIRSGIWDVVAVDMDRLHVRVGDQRVEKSAADLFEEEAEGSTPGWLKNRLPDELVVGPVTIDRFALDVVDELQSLQLRDSRVSMQPNMAAGTVRALGRGGDLVLRAAGASEAEERRFKVTDFTARLAGGAVFIDDAQLEYLGGSRLSARGEISPTGSLDLRLNLTDLNLAEVVEEDWKRRLLGRAQMESRIEGGGENQPPPRHEGELRIHDGILEGLPVLDQIASYTRVDRFRRLVLDTATADFHEQEGVVKVENMVMESAGLLRVEGGFVVQDEQILGVFDVGVAPETLRWIPGAEGRVFEQRPGSRPGFLWTTMTLSGPLESPREDLSSRLLAAAGEAVIDGVTDAGRGAVEGAGEAARLVPGLGKDLIESGRGLFDDSTKELPSRLLEDGLEGARGLLPLFR